MDIKTALMVLTSDLYNNKINLMERTFEDALNDIDIEEHPNAYDKNPSMNQERWKRILANSLSQVFDDPTIFRAFETVKAYADYKNSIVLCGIKKADGNHGVAWVNIVSPNFLDVDQVKTFLDGQLEKTAYRRILLCVDPEDGYLETTHTDHGDLKGLKGGEVIMEF